MKMNRREFFFRCAVLLAFVLEAAVCLQGFGALLTPKWLDDREWEPASEIMTGFYAEPTNTLDILFLGSSHVFCGVNPLCIYDETGLRSYDLASGLQRTWVSYYYLLEALKTQKPALVVLDTSELFDDGNNTEPRNRMAFDYMKQSCLKWKAVAVSAQPEESLLSYLFPVIRYHERTFDLSEQDFQWIFRKNHHNYLHGYRFEYMDRAARVSFREYDKTEKSTSDVWKSGSKSKLYLDLMAETCGKNRIELVLVTIPTTFGWGWPEHCRIRGYAEEKGLKYYDFNAEIQEIGLSPNSDFYDATHLNIHGAAKFSRFLGKNYRTILPWGRTRTLFCPTGKTTIPFFTKNAVFRAAVGNSAAVDAQKRDSSPDGDCVWNIPGTNTCVSRQGPASGRAEPKNFDRSITGPSPARPERLRLHRHGFLC